MIERFWSRPPRGVVRFALAAGLVTAATPVVALLHLLLPELNLAITYLPAVMLAAVLAGATPALGAATLAFLAYNFLFVAPHFTLTVSDPQEWANLAVFFAVAVATGQLASIARARAVQATRNGRDVATQFRLVRALSGGSTLDGMRDAAQILAEETGTQAVAIRLRRESEAGSGPPGLLARMSHPDTVRDAVILEQPDEERPAGRWVRPRRQVIGNRRDITGERFARVRILTGEDDGWIVLGPVHDRLRDANIQQLLVTAAALIGAAARRDRLVHEANEAALLRESERLRTAMLNAVSHDLRSPLSSIIASAESLLQTDVAWSDQDQREFLQAIASEGRRLARMVDHLLDYSRVESGALHLAPAWVEPGEVVLDVIQHLQPLLHGYPVTLDVPARMDAAFIDEIAIGEAISNLIENAVAHTPTGTHILVRVRRPEASFEVVVEDDGPGIPIASLPGIFEPFKGAGTAGRRTSGLGLAITRGIVEAHGGTVRAENRRGGGARFTITLVQRRPPASSPDQERTE